jgi:hypothetical protein
LLIILSLTLALLPSAFTSPASATAPSHLGATVASKSDIGWRILRAKHGGTVYGPDNVSITVPPGAMKRNGRVSVQEIYPGVYNIHITPKWKGRVTVRLPMSGDLPVVAHKQKGKWVLERAHVRGGQAVARVTSLSLFSAIRGCVTKMITPDPRVGALNTIRCFIKHGVRAMLPKYIARKIVGLFNDWDPCKPVGWDNWSIDAFEIFLSSCHAGETTVPRPAPPVVPPTPAPVPPKPAPVPAPAPGPVGRTIVVNTCNTYNNCDYWNPIWVHSNPAVSSRIADVSRGTALTGRCWAGGRTLTDGSNNTAEDDARQFTSALWYGVDWNGGRGYVPAVWTTKREDHLGLPAC